MSSWKCNHTLPSLSEPTRQFWNTSLFNKKLHIHRLLSMIPSLLRSLFTCLRSNLELRSWHRTGLNELPLVFDFYKCPQAKFAWFCGWTNFRETLGVARVAWLLEQSLHIDVAWVKVLASTPYADWICYGLSSLLQEVSPGIPVSFRNLTKYEGYPVIDWHSVSMG